MWGFTGEALAVLWSAAATAVVGLVAVAGVIILGLKQSKISNRQAMILERQVELEGMKLAHDLYERRYRAFDASAALLTETIQGTRSSPSAEISSRFVAALIEARFLFPKDVEESMRVIWDKVHDSYELKKKMKLDFEISKSYDEKDEDKELIVDLWLDDRLRSLHEIFPQLNMNDW